MDLSEAFEILADDARRRLLAELCGGETTTIEELSRQVADGAEGDSERVHTRLVHVHLPKLAGSGVVEYDRRNGDVVPTDAVADLHSIVEDARELETIEAPTA